MISDALLEDLRYRGEGTDLDFKAARYPFANATENEKSELLKDVLALANASREGTAYILMGFKENSPHPAEVVGLPADGAIDDSRIQEFINGKLDSVLSFRYEERMFDDKHVAVIAIPKQQRPFYIKKDYGDVKANVVYVRRGSSTGVASPREIATMGEGDSVRGEAQIELLLRTEYNQALPDRFDRKFLVLVEKLPDYEVNEGSLLVHHSYPNRDYYRESVEYYSERRRAIAVRVMLKNHSEFTLGNVQVEVTCRGSEQRTASLLRSDDMLSKPERMLDIGHYAMKASFRTGNRRMVVDDRGDEELVRIDLGSLRPGQTTRAEEDLTLLPSEPGSYVIGFRILANELPNPLLREHAFEVVGTIEHVSLKSLRSMIYTDPDLG